MGCTDARHETTVGTMNVQSSARLWLDCGSAGDPEWFSCCQIGVINRRRTSDDQEDTTP